MRYSGHICGKEDLLGSISRRYKVTTPRAVDDTRLCACAHGYMYIHMHAKTRASPPLFVPCRISDIIGPSVLCTRRPLETAECHRPPRPRSPRSPGLDPPPRLTDASATVNIARETAPATHPRNLESPISVDKSRRNLRKNA